MPRNRYHAKAIKQTMRFNGVLIGCTDTAFAMCVDAETLGGCRVTERYVRSLSNESHPDPKSPGLNLDQLSQVAQKLRVDFRSRKGANRAALIESLNNNKRVVAQLWYAGIGGTPIGHAVYVEQVRDGNARIVDPIKGKYEWIDQTRLFDAMRTFADKAGLNEGLLWGETRACPWISTDQKPQGGTDK